MSRYYKIDTRGKHWLQRVSGVPAWQASDEGRVIYDLITNSIYFANNSLWQAGGKYADIPQNTILLIESDVQITGYTLLTNKDDMTIYVTKGSGAGGENGGTDKAGGTWSQPTHQHTQPTHTHTVVNHSHSLNSHVHTQIGPTGSVATWAPRDEGGGSNTCADTTHTHNLSGNTGGAAGSTGADSSPTNAGGGDVTGNDNMGSAWRPKGRNFTRQQRT